MNTFQNKFLKELHEVNTETTDTCVLLETGEVPLNLFARRLCIKNWTRIKKGLNNTPLTVSSQRSQNKNHHWPELIKAEPFSIGLRGLIHKLKQPELTYIMPISDENLIWQNAFLKFDTSSKLRTSGKWL